MLHYIRVPFNRLNRKILNKKDYSADKFVAKCYLARKLIKADSIIISSFANEETEVLTLKKDSFPIIQLENGKCKGIV